MTTEQIIDIINTKSRKRKEYSIRQAISLILYEKGLTSTSIGMLVGLARHNVFYCIYNMRDLIQIKDPLSIESYNELSKEHTIEVQQQLVDTKGRRKTICTSILLDGVELLTNKSEQ